MIQSVGVILVKQDGSVLAQHRDNKPNILSPNTWAVVGGGRKVGADSDLVAACIRELYEETGYKADRKDLNFLARDTYSISPDLQVERIILWARYDDVQKIDCNEGREIRFIDPNEFAELNFSAGSESFLKKASEKAFYSGGEFKK